jgi:Cu+-exporting ATPase
LASGIGRFHSALLPGQKVSLVQDLQKSGKRVVMAGDGINDAPALAQADVGISVGRGTDIAMGTSGLIIPSGDLTRIADAIQLSRIITRVIRQNLFWAFGYNIVAIPIAAMGLLSPMIAAGAMAMSSVSVVLNSLRLFRFRPDLTK